MSQGYELLVAEVDRVVNSPYPTQLKQLHTIICQKCSDADVLEWAAARPCQVDALARSLIHALQQWPYVLEIITKLSNAATIRDTLLKHEPTLLFDTVSQAVNGSWKHNAASIALLSHPLPNPTTHPNSPPITLPASSQNLFLGIVDHATHAPSTASIKPIYQLLKGGLSQLLGLLSHETLSQLERHFLDVLRNTIGQEDQCLSLYCLAIMKALVTAADEDPSFSNTAASYETQELLASTPNSPRWKPKNMRQYFSGDKASKTLHLIVLRVLWASRATEGSACEETVECLGLANELVMFMPEATRETWCAENPIIVRKLQEKASQSELETRVQLPAFAFICSLCCSRNIPEMMVDRLASILSQTGNLTKELSMGPEPAVGWFAGVLNGVQLAEIVISITDFAVKGSEAEVIRLSGVVVPVVECLAKSLRTHDSIVDGALAALGSASVAQDLTKLRQTFSGESASFTTKDGICGAAALSARKDIGHAVCGLLLSAALAADHSQTDVASELYPLLIDTHALSVRTSAYCAHAIALPHSQSQKLSITASDLPYKPGTDWQQALAKHLQSKAQQDQSALSAFFSNACADLERRCTEVEAPLREEREKRADLQLQYDNLYRAYTTLEDNKSRVEMRADTLEAEKAEATHELEQYREENDELLARVESLEASLRQNQDQARQELEELKRETANAEMGHAASLARSEEQMEELEAKLAGVRAERDGKENSNAQLQRDLEDAKSSRNSLEAELRDWHVADEEHKRVIAAAEEAKDKLASRCESLLADIEAVRQSASAEKEAHDAAVARLGQETYQEAEAILAQHADELQQAQQTHQQKLNDLSAKLTSAQDDSKQAQTDWEVQREKRDKKLAEYHKKIEHLRAVCLDKDDQIAEANAMRSNLMAAMGLGKMPPDSQSAKRRSTRSAANQSELLDATDPSMPFIDLLGAATKATQSQPATQDSYLAPSPKRARSRKSGVSMPPPTQQGSRATRSSTQGRRQSTRQPLLAVSGNFSPSKSMSKTPRAKGMESEFVGPEDTTFDGSEVFASTPGVKRRQEVLPDDDTVME